MKNSMKTKALIYGMSKKSFHKLSKTEKIRLYLNDHPECLTENLMAWVASYYMNYGYIRMRIKELYPQIIQENLMNNNFVVITANSDEEE